MKILAMTAVAIMLATSPAIAEEETDTSTPNKYQNTGEWFTWPRMTGDWGGVRTDLAAAGIELDVRMSLYNQGVASGGVNTNFGCGGKFDYLLKADGEKLGLWEGFSVIMHAETQFGESIVGDAGAFAFANTAMLYPLPNEHDTTPTRPNKNQTGAAAGETGNDPRDFSSKFMPYYRYTKLRNGFETNEWTVFGLHAFVPQLAMTYEMPFGKTAEFNPRGPVGFDECGMGDFILRFFYRPKMAGVTEFNWANWGPGPRKTHNLSLMPLIETTLPTHTEDVLGSDSVIASPGFVLVADMPAMGFVAAMNFLDISVWRGDDTPYTLRLRSRIFYQQPLRKPGPGLADGWYLMPELQPIYDFRDNHFSFWIAPEIGKIVIPGKLVIYGKPGWGWHKKWDRESGGFDREFTFEFGMRIFL